MFCNCFICPVNRSTDAENMNDGQDDALSERDSCSHYILSSSHMLSPPCQILAITISITPELLNLTLTKPTLEHSNPNPNAYTCECMSNR